MDPGPLTPPILCLVTAGTSSPDFRIIRQAALAGVDLVHVRERRHDDRSLLALVRAAIDAVADSRARVVVNDRVDVALVAGAAGVHLRGDSIAAAEVRRIAPAGFLVGRSVHAVQEAVDAELGGGCDYVVFGTVFESSSKPPGHVPAGLDSLASVCDAVRLPVLAIGGVTVENAARVAAAGAAGVAAISLFAGGNVSDAVRAVRRQFDTCYPQRK